MNKYELVSKIEKFAPLETQDSWDCSGWVIDNSNVVDIHKVMLALTVTDDVVEQARQKQCDMIISHHPQFCVPIKYKDIQMYASHTPTDKALGGTTDTLISKLGLTADKIENEYVRIVNLDKPIEVNNFRKTLNKLSENVRLINNKSKKEIQTIGFCAGSGSEFLACTDTDCYVTGDLKYHTAVDTDKVVFDIGHFESEILILEKFKYILGIEVEFAHEKSPFI